MSYSVKKLNAHYISLQALYWGCYGTIWAFMSVLLLYRGFTNTQIGAVSATALLSVSLIFQPQMSALVDRDKRFTSRGFSMLLIIIAMAAALCMWICLAPILSAICYVIVGVCLLAIAPFFNAMAMELIQKDVALNFGLARGIGSGFYGLAALVIGLLTTHFAPTLILPIGIAAFLVLLLSVFLFRYHEQVEKTVVKASSSAVLGNFALLRRYPAFTATLVGAAFLMSSHGSTCTYMIHIVGKTGADKSALGIALAIGAFVEVPAMALFSCFQRRFSLQKVFCICALGFLVRNLLFLSATSVIVVYITVFLQFFECGLFIPASVYCAKEFIDEANLVKAQSLMHMASHGIGSALGVLISGRLLDFAGVNGMLIFTSACTAIGTIIVFFVMNKRAR